MINFDIEFWNVDTGYKFKEAASDLINHGYSEEEAKDFLESIYNSVSNEFGA